MKKINYNNIIKSDFLGEGTFGDVHKAYYGNKTFALKNFKEKKYLDGKRKKIDKISANIEHPNLIIPKYWVIDKNGITNKYLTEFIDAPNLNNSDYLELDEKICILRDLKNTIVDMHNEGIIHCDLLPCNILLDKGICKIIDFDNSSYNKSIINIKQINDYSLEYIKTYGIDKGIDIFLFNLITYSFLNETNIHWIRGLICKGNYKFFDDNKDAIKICDTFYLQDDKPNYDFLIDTIDDSKII